MLKKLAVFVKLKKLGAKRIFFESDGIYTFKSENVIPEGTLKKIFPSAAFRIFYSDTNNGKELNYYEMFLQKK